MGYTHYFTQMRDLTDKEWEKLKIAVQDIIDESDVLIVRDYDSNKPPLIDDKVIWFNGSDGDGHETFSLNKTMRVSDCFDFCKTACKPYDCVVTATLCAAEFIAPGAWEVGSDGNKYDWEDGVALAASVIDGEVADTVQSGIFAHWESG